MTGDGTYPFHAVFGIGATTHRGFASFGPLNSSSNSTMALHVDSLRKVPRAIVYFNFSPRSVLFYSPRAALYIRILERTTCLRCDTTMLLMHANNQTCDIADGPNVYQLYIHNFFNLSPVRSVFFPSH